MGNLDNAATPLGIKAMQELQTLNPNKETASNAQILFLVINTSAVTLFPITIFTYRTQLGAAHPTDVFIPILLATYMSTLCGLLAVAWIQKNAVGMASIKRGSKFACSTAKRNPFISSSNAPLARKTPIATSMAIIADFAGIISAIFIAYWFFA
jgi:hypothetical protein